MAVLELAADFLAFPDRSPVPDDFALGGFRFGNMAAPGTLFVNAEILPDGSFAKGLQGSREARLWVKLPRVTDRVWLSVGIFSPMAIRARGSDGMVLYTHELPEATGTVDGVMLSHAGIAALEFDLGAEGLLARVAVVVMVAEEGRRDGQLWPGLRSSRAGAVRERIGPEEGAGGR